MRDSPYALELTVPLYGHRLAVSANPADCIVFLERVLARVRREARATVDPIVRATTEAEAERLEKVLGLIQREVGLRSGAV